MKRNAIRASLIAGTAVLGVIGVSAAQQTTGSRDFMRLKLVASQKVLEGLVREDFEAIAKNAEELRLLSLDASWQVLQTAEYAQQSLEFRRSAEAVTVAAKKKNLDGAALAYLEVTMKCVNCHKYVRAAQMPK
jgi:cytochrome c556